MVASPKLVKELRGVLLREKFRRYATEQEAYRFVEAIERLAIVVQDPGDVARVSKDPNDDYLVALAVSVSGILVSGDQHLLDLDQLEPRVLRPREFLESVS